MIQQFLSPKKKQQSLIARKPSEVPSWIGLIVRKRSIYAFRSSQRDLHNGAVQFVIWQTCLDRSDRFKGEVWPVCPDYPENLHRANFECQHMPLFLGKSCVPRNISPSPKIHLNNEKHLHTNHVLLWRTISYIGHVNLCKWDRPEYIQSRLWIMSFKGAASVHLVL